MHMKAADEFVALKQKGCKVQNVSLQCLFQTRMSTGAASWSHVQTASPAQPRRTGKKRRHFGNLPESNKKGDDFTIVKSGN